LFSWILFLEIVSAIIPGIGPVKAMVYAYKFPSILTLYRYTTLIIVYKIPTLNRLEYNGLYSKKGCLTEAAFRVVMAYA
jgi:hypothetical protein